MSEAFSAKLASIAAQQAGYRRNGGATVWFAISARWSLKYIGRHGRAQQIVAPLKLSLRQRLLLLNGILTTP